MNKIAVVGKIDSRALVYPMAKSLVLNGMTAIIADDGAYRRLYHGRGNVGTVSGVDIAVTDKIDENYMDVIAETGINYENIIIVSNDYIPEDATGIIACHGVDRSILAVETEDDSDDFIAPPLVDSNKDAETNEDEEKASKKKKKASKKAVEDEESAVKEEAEKAETVKEAESENPEQEEDNSWRAQALKIQQENPDKLIIPDDVPFVETQIAYSPVPKKSNIVGIALKESTAMYMYSCEERKELMLPTDKVLLDTTLKITSKVTGIGVKELGLLASKKEGVGAPDKKKKK